MAAFFNTKGDKGMDAEQEMVLSGRLRRIRQQGEAGGQSEEQIQAAEQAAREAMKAEPAGSADHSDEVNAEFRATHRRGML